MSVFTYLDAIDAARERLDDEANMRVTDDEILSMHLPRALQQLRADRPDLWLGLYGTEAFKPTTLSATMPFADEGFTPLVDALVAGLAGKQDEPSATPKESMADARSERARKGR